jgi:hypothetical protein
MTEHSAPEKPKPLEKKESKFALGIAAFLVLIVLVGWWISIADVLKDGFGGAREGVNVIVDTGEDIKYTTQAPLQQTSETMNEFTDTIVGTIEKLEETKNVLDDVVVALPDVIDDHEDKQQQEQVEKETEITSDVLELTQEKLQAE